MTADPRAGESRLSLGWRRVLVAVLLAALLALLVMAEAAHSTLLRLIDQAERLAGDHPALAILLVLVFAALSAMLAFVSSAVIAPFVAHHWGTGTAVFLLWTGWLLGGALTYGTARFLGRPLVRGLASPRLLARYEARISQHTSFGLVLLLQLALPSEVPGYLLGLVRYAFPRYLASLALAELPYAVATVFLGASVVERRLPVIAAVGLALVLLSALTFQVLHRRLGKR